MSDRRSYGEIKKDIEMNARDILSANYNERMGGRVQVVVGLMLVEVLLDIREHLDEVRNELMLSREYGIVTRER